MAKFRNLKSANAMIDLLRLRLANHIGLVRRMNELTPRNAPRGCPTKAEFTAANR